MNRLVGKVHLMLHTILRTISISVQPINAINDLAAFVLPVCVEFMQFMPH